MKKYKHKITGNIAIETSSEKNYKVSEPRNFTVPKWIVENSCDWEEVKEKEYEILGVRTYKGDIYTWEEVSFDNWWKSKEHFLKYHLEDNPKSSIYTIKRLSDGEIFTIGDKIGFDKKDMAITEISLDRESSYRTTIRVVPWLQCGKNYGTALIFAKKAKPVLFTTEDGVDIREGDEFWHVDTFLSIGKGKMLNDTFIPLQGYKQFSSKEAAEEYVAKEKGKQLLEEAKKRYPIGSKVKSITSGNVYVISETTDFYWGTHFIGDGGKGITSNDNGWVYLDGKWAEIVKEKTLEDYENILLTDNYISYDFCKDKSIRLQNSIFYKWAKENEPKLYWTKVLQLIADDLNEGWKPDWKNGNQFKYFIETSDKNWLGIHTASTNKNYSIDSYFKSTELTEKAIQIMGDKLDYIFK